MTDKLPPLVHTTVTCCRDCPSAGYKSSGYYACDKENYRTFSQIGRPTTPPVWCPLKPLQAVREAVPEGFVLVPVEPTEAMLQAALDCQDADPEDGSASEVYYGYKAMLAAAKEAK